MSTDNFEWCTAESVERRENAPELDMFLVMRETDECVAYQFEERDGPEGAWISAAVPWEVKQ